MKVWEHLRTRGSGFNLYLSLVNDASDRTRLIMDLLFALLIFSLGIYIEVSPSPVSSSVLISASRRPWSAGGVAVIVCLRCLGALSSPPLTPIVSHSVSVGSLGRGAVQWRA